MLRPYQQDTGIGYGVVHCGHMYQCLVRAPDEEAPLPPRLVFTCMLLGMTVSGGQHVSEQTGMGGGRCDVKHVGRGIVDPKYKQSSDGQRR